MENNLSIVKDTFKELPNNIEAEQAVIGSILVQNEIFDEINTIISSINFYDPMHQNIFSAIESLIYKGMLANPITLKNYFENEKDELNIPEYLVKVTKFSTPPRQAIEYSIPCLDDVENLVILTKYSGTFNSSFSFSK